MWAKVLFTIFHSPSMRDSEKKSVNDNVPQKPVSSIAAVAASPTC